MVGPSLTFGEIEKLSKHKFKKLLSEKTKTAAFMYLKEQQQKQKNIRDICYEKLTMQHYFFGRSVEVSKTIFRARGRCLNIKMQQRWKYDDVLCVGCRSKEESGEEILQCKEFGEINSELKYDMFFENEEKQILVGNEMTKRLRERKKILEKNQ